MKQAAIFRRGIAFCLISALCLAGAVALRADQTMGDWVHPKSPYPGPMYPTGIIPTDGNDLNNITIVTSRTSGVAPLYVFFDASNSPGMQVPATLNDGTNYQDINIEATYVWNFDATGVDSNTKYDRVSGFVAGHVFNQPGTYTVRLDVFDKQRRHGSQTVTITVLPFTGTTYYVASTGSDSYSGLDMAHPVLTVQHALIDLAKPNTQILFRNGDVFNLTDSNGLSLSGNGPVIVSGYSDPNQPSATAPELHATYADNSWYVFVANTNDWRFVGLKITATGNNAVGSPRYPGGIQFPGTSSNNLLSRLEMKNLASAMVFGLIGDNNAIYECEMHVFSGYGIFSTNVGVTGKRLSIIGNYLHDMELASATSFDHSLRVQGGDSDFVGFNVFESEVMMSDIQIRGNTNHVVVYGNVLDRSSGFHPQNSSVVEEVHHCACEANIFIARVDPVTGAIDPAYVYAHNNGGDVSGTPLGIAGHDIVIRNNLIYNYEMVVQFSNQTPLIPNSTRVIIENNTLVKTLPIATVDLMEEAASTITLHNNLLYSAASSNTQYDAVIYNVSGSPFNGTSDNNQMFGKSWPQDWHFFGYYPNVSLAQWQTASGQDLHSWYADPGIAEMNPLNADFAAPAVTSAGVNKGTATGGWLDLYGYMRDATPDIGAIEYGSAPTSVQPTMGPTVIATNYSSIDMHGKNIAVFPNPAKKQVNIIFVLTGPAAVNIDIFNLAGQRVASLKKPSPGGRELILWDTSNTAAGVYFGRVTVDNKEIGKFRLAIIK